MEMKGEMWNKEWDEKWAGVGLREVWKCIKPNLERIQEPSLMEVCEFVCVGGGVRGEGGCKT